MKSIVIAGAFLLASVGGIAWADEAAPMPKPKIPPGEVTVKIVAPEGTSDADIARGIAEENARRDPAAQDAARVAKRKADAEQAHRARVDKVCDAIPDDALARDPSLRRLCGE
ncbi:MAG: hypothetical protein B6D46_14690 [Polyangiaceae bacterium UTPRO1]|jgi:uncharacterized protein with LGFP repeats|nr:hypothetical protein [Myxococcales bacterium]OQY65085.1 MAG: hypothetical protein B6D46_14690 [Polyangiaceae bacterium UTPRO1]